MTTNDQVTAILKRILPGIVEMGWISDEECSVIEALATERAATVTKAQLEEHTQPAGVESRLKYAIAALMQIYRGWPTPDKFAKEALDFINDPGNWPSDAAPISEDMVETRAKELSDQYKAGHADGWREGREDMADPTGARYSDGADPSVTEGDAPDFHDDLISRLREYAAEPGYSHGDYADTMREAANVLADRAARTPASVGSEAKGEAAGSIGADPEFCRLAKAWGTWNAGLSDYAALVAYIDSRIAAAPERSGKAADEQPVAWALQALNGKIFYWSSSKETCEKQQENTWVKDCQLVAVYTRPATAGNSSAAPSDAPPVGKSEASKWNRGTLVERLYNDPPNVGILVEAGAEIQRLRAELNAAIAAPAPTGESLSAAVSKAIAALTNHCESDPDCLAALTALEKQFGGWK